MRKLPAAAQEERRPQVIGLRESGLTYEAIAAQVGLMRWRGRMLGAATKLKMVLGMLLIVAGVMTLSGLDRVVQTVLEQALPDWFLAVTTRI
ncbi:hypothetical protein KGO5_06256 [Sinorhizobium sp. KGO-5]|nr:hypothetical protein KGO5_06256 [Sinorhizobium sp. KGO-5]